MKCLVLTTLLMAASYALAVSQRPLIVSRSDANSRVWNNGRTSVPNRHEDKLGAASLNTMFRDNQRLSFPVRQEFDNNGVNKRQEFDNSGAFKRQEFGSNRFSNSDSVSTSIENFPHSENIHAAQLINMQSDADYQKNSFTRPVNQGTFNTFPIHGTKPADILAITESTTGTILKQNLPMRNFNGAQKPSMNRLPSRKLHESRGFNFVDSERRAVQKPGSDSAPTFSNSNSVTDGGFILRNENNLRNFGASIEISNIASDADFMSNQRKIEMINSLLPDDKFREVVGDRLESDRSTTINKNYQTPDIGEVINQDIIDKMTKLFPNNNVVQDIQEQMLKEILLDKTGSGNLNMPIRHSHLTSNSRFNPARKNDGNKHINRNKTNNVSEKEHRNHALNQHESSSSFSHKERVRTNFLKNDFENPSQKLEHSTSKFDFSSSKIEQPSSKKQNLPNSFQSKPPSKFDQVRHQNFIPANLTTTTPKIPTKNINCTRGVNCSGSKITKNVYIYERPNSATKVKESNRRSRKNYDIIFIKNNNNVAQMMESHKKKTIIYVLNEKPGSQDAKEVIQDKEVYYVNYGDGENPLLPHGQFLHTELNNVLDNSTDDDETQSLLNVASSDYEIDQPFDQDNFHQSFKQDNKDHHVQQDDFDQSFQQDDKDHRVQQDDYDQSFKQDDKDHRVQQNSNQSFKQDGYDQSSKQDDFSHLSQDGY